MTAHDADDDGAAEEHRLVGMAFASRYLGITRAELLDLKHRGVIRAEQVTLRRPMFLVEDLDAYRLRRERDNVAALKARHPHRIVRHGGDVVVLIDDEVER